MPVFTAIAAAVTAFTGFTFLGSVAAFAAKAVLFNGVSKLIGNRQGSNATGSSNAGARVQIPPATDNKLPVIYGSAFVAPTITDAKLTTDQKSMYYVCTLSEVTNTMAGQTPNVYTFDKIFYGGKEVTFGTGGDAAKVVSLTTNSDPVQVDTTINGNMFIYLFPNGSSSGTNTGGATAIDILSSAEIPADQRWNSAFYTAGGDSASMTNTAFMIVKLIYNQDAGTTGLDQLTVQLTNPLNTPGAVLYDYMYNNAYGCGIPAGQIDTASLTALDVYSAQLITYNPVSGPPTTQARYIINGPLNTGNNCLSNLQQLVDACDSWLQYSELTGKWKVVINKPYTGATSSLYHVNSDVLIGGIDINPIDLNETYNSLEVQYPNANIKDQTDFRVIDLTDPTSPWYDPSLLSYNEPDNRLVINYSQVNNYVQAVYLGVRRLLQSREDLTVNFMLDYSGIQIEAGDVIRVTLEEYGWDAPTFPDGKLFRVSQVQEAKLEDGTLGARIVAFEYNDSVYTDNAINDFVPETNTGLTDPNIISAPGTPVLTVNPLSNGNVKSFNVQATVPASGSVLYMDFNYGYTNDVTTHVLYRTVSSGNGSPFASGETIRIDVNDAPPATYYVSVAARNNNAGKVGASATAFVWDGPGVTVYDPVSGEGGIMGDNVNGNIELTGNILYSGANFTYSNVANLHIPGGTYAFYLQTDGAGNLSWGSGGNGTDNPGGANRAIQFNDEGNLGGVANFTWDKDTEIMRAPVIQLSNGAEKITTLASGGNLYMTGWSNVSSMPVPSLFSGRVLNNPSANVLNPTGTESIGNIRIERGNVEVGNIEPYTSMTKPIANSLGYTTVISNNIFQIYGNGATNLGGTTCYYSTDNGNSWANTYFSPNILPPAIANNIISSAVSPIQYFNGNYWISQFLMSAANLSASPGGSSNVYYKIYSSPNLVVNSWTESTIFSSSYPTVSWLYSGSTILYRSAIYPSFTTTSLLSTSNSIIPQFDFVRIIQGANANVVSSYSNIDIYPSNSTGSFSSSSTLSVQMTSNVDYSLATGHAVSTPLIASNGNVFLTRNEPDTPNIGNNTPNIFGKIYKSNNALSWTSTNLPNVSLGGNITENKVQAIGASDTVVVGFGATKSSGNASYNYFVFNSRDNGNSYTVISNSLSETYVTNITSTDNSNTFVTSVTSGNVKYSVDGNVWSNMRNPNSSSVLSQPVWNQKYQTAIWPANVASLSGIFVVPQIRTYNTNDVFIESVGNGYYQYLGGNNLSNSALFIKNGNI